MHIKLMEYDINLPANLSQCNVWRENEPKKKKLPTTATKWRVQGANAHSQITNSKKLKMYRKNKWNRMRYWMRWIKKRLLNVLDFFWLVLWLCAILLVLTSTALDAQWKSRRVSWQKPWTRRAQNKRRFAQWMLCETVSVNNGENVRTTMAEKKAEN